MLSIVKDPRLERVPVPLPLRSKLGSWKVEEIRNGSPALARWMSDGNVLVRLALGSCAECESLFRRLCCFERQRQKDEA